MAQRVEAPDSLDFFPTPPWATRALLEHVFDPAWSPLKTAREPACGRGDMARPLAEYFDHVDASDVHAYGFGRLEDFIWPSSTPARADWIITNPPFRLGVEFVRKALGLVDVGVAVLVRLAFLESDDRYEALFRRNPPTIVAQFVERVPMFKGRLDPGGSTATAYCWLVWHKTAERRPFTWIAPCRRRLERPGDYDGYLEAPAGAGPLFGE